MNYTIKNDRLTAQISDKGAELMSVIKDGVEYIWQGNPEYWSGRAYFSPPAAEWLKANTPSRVRFTTLKSTALSDTVCARL